MLSLMLIAAMVVQNPPAPKPTQDTTARRPATTTRSTTPRDTNAKGVSGSPISRTAFQNTMRELWTDHIVYTRSFIVAASAGSGDTAVVLQRLLRNQDEIGDALKPYYGDAAGAQLTALLRTHIQLAGKALMAVKGGTQTAMAGDMNSMNSSLRNDTTKMRSTDSTQNRTNSQNPQSAGKMGDTTRARSSTAQRADTSKVIRGNDTSAARFPTTTTTTTAEVAVKQQPDSQAQAAAVAALRANADSIADFLSKANARNWSRSTLQGALQMHINLLLQEATAQVKGDWQSSVTAFDASLDQALQMADMFSEGVMKQFPTRFSNKSTSVSSLQ